MAVRIPFFGLISLRSPLLGFLEHYEQIAKGMELIEESMECYITGGGPDGICKEFSSLQKEVDDMEDQADKIKRNIRNHLPRGIFLPVEKYIFFNYTHCQDDILDAGQGALQWLAMRPMVIPEVFQRDLIFYIAEVSKCVRMLRPAIEGTISWVNDEGMDREELKNRFRAVRKQHHEVTDKMHALSSKLMQSDLDFKDIYQLMHFAEYLHTMSHSAESCVNLLRVMIAK